MDEIMGPQAEAGPDVPSSPIFQSLACAFGLAIGELALLVGRWDDIEYSLKEACIAAQAAYMADTLRR